MKYLIAFLLPLATATQSITPGQWASEAHFKINGIPMPPTKDSSCISADEAKDPKTAIEKSLARNDCSLTSWKMDKSNLTATVKCKNDQYEAEGAIGGTFTKKSYALKGEVKGRHQLIGHATVAITFDGNWTGACLPE